MLRKFAWKSAMLSLMICLLATGLVLRPAAAAEAVKFRIEANGKPTYGSISLNEGETLQLSVVATDAQGTDRDVTKEAIFSTEYEEYFTIDPNGRLTARKETWPRSYRFTVSYGDWSSTISVTIRTPIPQFTDIENHWAREAIEWAAAMRVASGYGDNTFRPDETVSEAEFLAFLFRPRVDPAMLGIGNWVNSIYAYAELRNIPALGLTDPSARHEPITRARVAEIITAADGMHYTGDDAIQYVLGKGYASGKTGATIEGFQGEDHLTRAEALMFSYNLREVMPSINQRPAEPSPKSELPPLP